MFARIFCENFRGNYIQCRKVSEHYRIIAVSLCVLEEEEFGCEDAEGESDIEESSDDDDLDVVGLINVAMVAADLHDQQEQAQQEPEQEIEEEEEEREEQDQVKQVNNQPQPPILQHIPLVPPSVTWVWVPFGFESLPTSFTWEDQPEPVQIQEPRPRPIPRLCRYGKGCYRFECIYAHPEGRIGRKANKTLVFDI